MRQGVFRGSAHTQTYNLRINNHTTRVDYDSLLFVVRVVLYADG